MCVEMRCVGTVVLIASCTGGGPVARVWVINSTVKGYIRVRGTGVNF